MFNSYISTASVALLALSAIEPVAAAPIKAIESDFADPAVLWVDGKWFAYATGSGGKKVQYATADKFEGPWSVSGDDALPDTPGWVGSNPLVWAPDVVDRVCLAPYFLPVAMANNKTGRWQIHSVLLCFQQTGATLRRRWDSR